MSLKVTQLTKIYGAQKALDQVSFEAKKGEIVGFLGPNGAGKSTTMKIASGLILPDSGDVFINGVSVIQYPKKLSAQIGYLPENNPLYLEMYVYEFLNFIGKLYGLQGHDLKQAVSQQIDACGLSTEAYKKIHQLSKGYRQRVGLAKALIHHPSVVILDEPTTGLDPNQLVEIRKMIKEVAKDKTLILSTHILQEVEALCDKVVIINKGKIVSENTLSNMKNAGNVTKIHLETEEELLEEWFLSIEPIVDKEIKGNRLTLHTQEPATVKKQVLAIVQNKNLTLTSLQQMDNNLETMFRNLTQENSG
jgi:ABC-2 type transport system ATP-binding protein